MKKIFLTFCIFVVLIANGCSNTEQSEPGFIDRYAYISKEDGWIQELVISDYLVGEHKGTRAFFVNGINLKYKELADYYLPVLDESGKEVGRGGLTIPTYIHNNDRKMDVDNINKYLNEKQFNSAINVQDIQDLVVQYFTKEDVVTLVNQALLDPNAEKGFGKFSSMQSHSQKKDILDGTSLQLSYCSLYGYIRVVNIEYIYADGTYLSDLVEAGKADEQQIEAYRYLETLEKEIVEKQEIEIHDVISPSSDKDAYESALADLLSSQFKKR